MDIDQIIALTKLKIANNKKKWTYMLFPIIEEKKELGMSYEDIATWFEEKGLNISVAKLTNIYFYNNNKRFKKLSEYTEDPPMTPPAPVQNTATSAPPLQGLTLAQKEARWRELSNIDPDAEAFAKLRDM